MQSKDKPVWDKARPRSAGKPVELSPQRKGGVKAAAREAGRTYPNLVDNMRAAARQKKK
jgi:hypothetical protein